MTSRRRKVLLLFPSSFRSPRMLGMTDLQLHSHFHPVKFALLSLFSHLRGRGIETDILDLEAELGRPRSSEEVSGFCEGAKRLISSKDFDLAAISCYTSFEYTAAMEVGRICRRLNPRACLVAGGYHPSALPEDFTAPGSPFDNIITGEAETALAEIASGEIGCPSGQPRVIPGRPLELRDDDALHYESYPYLRPPAPVVSVVLSRGCPFRCDFCVESAIGAGWRTHSVSKSVKILEHLLSVARPSLIMIQDPLFGFQKSWRREFLEALVRRRFPVPLGLQIRMDILDQEDVDLLSKLQAMVQVGVETASPRMMGIMKKTTNPSLYLQRLRETLSYASRKEAAFLLNLLFNHPGETPATFHETLSFFDILSARLAESPFTIGPVGYSFLPGAPEFYGIADYEKEFGAQVLHKGWWRDAGQDSSETAVIASRETEHAFGRDFYYWFKPAHSLRKQILSKAGDSLKMALATASAVLSTSNSRIGSLRDGASSSPAC